MQTADYQFESDSLSNGEHENHDAFRSRGGEWNSTDDTRRTENSAEMILPTDSEALSNTQAQSGGSDVELIDADTAEEEEVDENERKWFNSDVVLTPKLEQRRARASSDQNEQADGDGL